MSAALAYYREHQAEIGRELIEDEREIAIRAKKDKSAPTERLRKAREERRTHRSHG